MRRILLAFVALGFVAWGQPPIPTISSLSPNSAVMGSPDLTLTVTGTNLVSGITPPVIVGVVLWNGTSLAAAPSPAPTATQLTVIVPASLLANPGSALITVQVGSATSNPAIFTVNLPLPVITALTPNSAVAGSGSLVLLVAGSNLMTFGDVATPGVVLWNGTALEAAASPAPSAGLLAAMVPENLLANPGSALVTVQVGDVVSAPAVFSIILAVPTPVIDALSPSSIAAGSPALTLTISGSNLALTIPGAGLVIPGTVFWNATLLRTADSPPPSTSQLTVVVPAYLLAKPGSASVTVQLDDVVSTPAVFSIILAVPTPVIGALSPSSIAAGSPDLTLTISGSNLALTTPGSGLVTPGTVFWNGTLLQAASSPPPSTTQLTVIVPAGLLANAGSASVTVQVEKVVSAPTTFTIYPPLAIVTTSLQNGTVGTAYSQTLTASGGVTPYAWSVASDEFVPGLSLSGAGAITGTPTTAGSFTFTIQVLDKVQGVARQPFTLTIDAAAPVITTLTPNSAVAGSGTLVLLVAGSNLMTAGNLPAPGVVLWNGTALQAAASPASSASQLAAVVPADLLANPGSASVTVRVGNATSAPAAFTITVPPLAVTTTSLPNGTVGAAYSQTLSATGGIAPYVWSITTGALPPGLALNATTGVIAGTPTGLGSFSFTAQVTDKQNATASHQVSIAVGMPPPPSPAINGLSDTANGTDQLAFSLGLSSGYPLPLAAHFTLTFSPDAVAPADDPAVQFAAGGRAIDVAIPAGTTQSPNVPFQTGTVAGTITVTLTGLAAAGSDITPSPVLTRTVRINRAAPTLTASSLKVTRRANGFDIQVSGFSTPREITQALFHFGAVAGTKLNGADVTISLSSAFSAWYTSTASVPFGSAFLYTQPFTVQGDPTRINSVSVTLSNSQGASQTLSATF